jgi:hypothetical protein
VSGTIYVLQYYLVLHDPADPLVKQGGLKAGQEIRKWLRACDHFNRSLIGLAHALRFFNCNSGAMPMQIFGATGVAALILFVADQFLNAGRYSEVAAHALKHAALLVGIDV